MPPCTLFRPTLALALFAAGFTAPSAQAQNVRSAGGAETATGAYYVSISPNQLKEILSAEKGRVSVADGDDTTLEGRVDGKNYDVFFYECDGADFAAPARPNSSCLGFEYRAIFEGYPSDGETVNLFNNDYHYGSLWRNEDGNLSLQLNVIVEGGVTEANIRITFAWWLAVLASFDEFMEGR